MKKSLFWLMTLVLLSLWLMSDSYVVAAPAANIEIVPKADQGALWTINTKLQDTTNGKHVRDNYNEIASWLAKSEDISTQVASGVMDRDTILNYAVVLLKFLSQAGILIGALMCVWTWYKYIMAVITWDGEPSKDTIKHAVYGILIIIFSYAIMRILTRAFLT